MQLFMCVMLSALAPVSLWAAGGGSTPSTSSGDLGANLAPGKSAEALYNDGVKRVTQADALVAAGKDARRQYTAALEKFEAAVDQNPNMHEAWNYIGYCRRQLGRYEDALGAYDEALRLAPDYAPAIEYRGQTFLGLGRIEDAKQAYLALFARDRALAGKLLASIKAWTSAPNGGGKLDPAAAQALRGWVAERERIATQTAALGRPGSAAGWTRGE
ncbi:MAG: tetratricopeptide repeat protein [Steroidobacteraceae bacterium]|nr:tetratricopeptide repeat protein [Steroidobacteraceae bacterium]MDW8259664.1 tetratricopeptide repeat protein [Gammaproteobacteria bacterium]